MHTWTSKDISEIKTRRAAGETLKSIGAHFSVTERAIGALARRKGLKATRAPKGKYVKVTEQTDMLIHPKQHIKQTRKCLKCTKEFISKWFGNRMCSDCKNETSTGIIEYSGGSSRRNGVPFGART